MLAVVAFFFVCFFSRLSVLFIFSFSLEDDPTYTEILSEKGR